jgi:glycosyltransferase involved in cell wall biosynthesis
MNKVLIVTYYWPPSGGAGVQRWLKFSKYLPEFGWEPIILTVDPEYATYPFRDDSLINDIPPGLRVCTTPATDYFRFYKKDKSKIPSSGFATNADDTLKGKLLRFVRGNFFIPDPRRGWNRYAIKKACELIETEGIGHVITTSPPHSTQLIGLSIKKRYPGLKWIADLRDPWTDIYYYKEFYPTIVSKWIDSEYQKLVLKNADEIITVGDSLKSQFSSKVEGLDEKIKVITNGYDASDFAGLIPSSPEIFTISYIGTLSDAYPVGGFLAALDSLKAAGNNFRLRFIGTAAPKRKDLITSRSWSTSVEFVPYVDHQKAIRYMLDSSVLLLIIPDHSGNKSIITGKLFEYIATGKPIICIGPTDGDAALILKKAGHSDVFSYTDSSGILDTLKASLSGKMTPGKLSSDEFSRKELTKKVVSLL